MFEVIIVSASKSVKTQAQVDTLVAKIQQAFGNNTHILVNQVEKTFDTQNKEAGVKVTRLQELPEGD